VLLTPTACQQPLIAQGPWQTQRTLLNRKLVRSKKPVRCEHTASVVKTDHPARIVGLQINKKTYCAAWTAETIRVIKTRKYRSAGCPPAVGLLCALLPLTALTALAGIPLVAYGGKKAKDAEGHNSNAVGMIAAGAILIAAGLAGVIACPLVRAYEKKARRTVTKKKTQDPKQRIGVKSTYVCRTEAQAGEKLRIALPDHRKQKDGALTVPIAKNGRAIFDLATLLARYRTVTPPQYLLIHPPQTDPKQSPLTVDLPAGVRHKLAARIRTQTMSLAPSGDSPRATKQNPHALKRSVGGKKHPILLQLVFSCNAPSTLEARIATPDKGLALFVTGQQEQPPIAPENTTWRAYTCRPDKPAAIWLLALPGHRVQAAIHYYVR
jgi:hypothetical protein